MPSPPSCQPAAVPMRRRKLPPWRPAPPHLCAARHAFSDPELLCEMLPEQELLLRRPVLISVPRVAPGFGNLRSDSV
ncbi:hypothetical protein ZWY2020_040937 [Hordeum vulgare]|nr:hypothetical protein ZWY2020_040937 [Hordeum vulgare]